MSEPDQLFGRVHMTRERFDAFLATVVPPPAEDQDVLAWLAEAKYYGPRYTAEKIGRQVEARTVAAWAEEVTGPGPWGVPMPSRNVYDATSQSWTVAAVEYSENYDDFIAAVAVFRAAARFKDLPGDDGLVILSYLFGSEEPTVVVRVDEGTSAFAAEDDARSLIAQAVETMDALMAEGAAHAAATGEA